MTLASQLSALEARGLLRSLGDPADPEYLFRHTLFQETAYGSLLRGERLGLHRSVAHALESAYPGDRESLAPILGYHFLQAGDELKALDYLSLAAEAAAKVYANQEALEHYRASIDLARRVRPEEDLLGKLYAGCGRVHELMGDLEGALQTYESMEAVARELGFSRMALKGRVARDTLHSSPSSVSGHARLDSATEETLRLAREAGDREAEARSLWNLMLQGFFYGQKDEPRRLGEQALQIARELGNRELQAFIANDLSRNYLFSKGNSERGGQLAAEAREVWQALDNQPMLADSLSGSAMFAAFVGDYPAALEFSEKALALSNEIDNPWGKSYSQYHLNFVYAELGDFPEALRRGDEALSWAEVAGFIVPAVTTRAFQGWIMAQLGRYDEAIEMARRAVEFGRKSLPSWTPMALSTLALASLWKGDRDSAAGMVAELEAVLKDPEAQVFPLALAYASLAPMHFYLSEGDYPSANAAADRLIEWRAKVNFDNYYVDALMVKAGCAAGVGDFSSSWEWWVRAREEAERIGSKRTLWQILYRMGEWSEQQKQVEQAAKFKAQSRANLTEIVDRLDPDLRQSLLSTPLAAKAWGA